MSDSIVPDEKIVLNSPGGVEIEYEIAGVGSRSYAFILDWHFRFIIALAWFFLLALLVAGTLDITEAFDKLEDRGKIFLYAAVYPALIIYFFYHPILEHFSKGRTPGKRMAGIRVVALSGRTASDGAMLLRNVFRIVDSLPVYYSLGLVVAIFSKRNQRIGDMAAGTVLIYEKQTRRKRLDQLLDAQQRGTLSAEQIDLVSELVNRWKELDQKNRIGLAEQVLKQINMTLPDRGRKSKYEQALLDLLQQALQVGLNP